MSYEFRGKQLPEHLEESLRAYVETGRPTGGFLRAILTNDLSMACRVADEENIWLIPVVVGFIYQNATHVCWGTKDAYNKWIESKYAIQRRAHTVTSRQR